MYESFDSDGGEPERLPYNSHLEGHEGEQPFGGGYGPQQFDAVELPAQDPYASADILNLERRQAEHTQLMDEYVDIADSFMGERYTTNPALHTFAVEKADFFTGGACVGFDTDETHPAAATLKKAYTRLFMAFTDPADYNDTLSGELMLEQLGKTYRELTEWDEDPDFQSVVTVTDRMSAHYVLVEYALRLSGQLDGFTADQRYALVDARMEILIQADLPPDSPYHTDS